MSAPPQPSTGSVTIASPSFYDRAAAVPASPLCQAVAAPFLPFTGINYITREYVGLLDPLSVLRIVAHYLSGTNNIRLPPFKNENVEIWRALSIGNVPKYMGCADSLRILRPRALESIRQTKEQNGTSSLELRFVDHMSALQFYAQHVVNPRYLNQGLCPTISWIPSGPLSSEVAEAVSKRRATRTLIVEVKSEEPESTIRSMLWQELSKVGQVETLITAGKPSPPQSFWEITFLSIESAIEAEKVLCEDFKEVQSVRFKGEAPLHKLEEQAAMLFLNLSPYDPTKLKGVTADVLMSALAHQSLAAALVHVLSGGDVNIGNRCICISRLPATAKLVEICNTVRGGMLESVKLISGKNICFVTFLEPTAAAQFWATYQMKAFYINCERVRVGWGHPSGPLAPEVEAMVGQNITRNICIKFGPQVVSEQRDDEDEKLTATRVVIDEKKLWEIFSPFGTIEQVRVAQHVLCSFVSFTNIVNAAQAVDWAKKTNRFPMAQVQYGKDRCAALPRCLLRNPDDEGSLIKLLRLEVELLYAQTNPYSVPYPNGVAMAPPYLVAPMFPPPLLYTGSRDAQSESSVITTPTSENSD